MDLQHQIKFYGAALDALDTDEAVAIKVSNLDAQEKDGAISGSHSRDPYDLFRDVAGNLIKSSGHKNLGRFSVESWLSPRPKPEERALVSQTGYYQFFKQNGFALFSKMLKDFVQARVFPGLPGMVGVDHSLTGGVLMALAERFGPKDLAVIVFDTHTDAVSLPIRAGLKDYTAKTRSSGESKSITDTAVPEDLYSAGNFLLHLLNQGVLLPQNLIIIGPSDGPEPFRGMDDDKILSYVNHHDALAERGVTLISKADLESNGPAVLEKKLNALSCRNLYVSLDIDVSALRGVLAARFIDVAGCDTRLILQTAELISEQIFSGNFQLAGLDIMEIDVHKLGARLKSGDEDGTADFLQKFISLFLKPHPEN